jgi:hypothetical protein
MIIFVTIFLLPIVFLAIRAILLLYSQYWSRIDGNVISHEIATQTTYPPFYEIHGKMEAKWLKVKYTYNVSGKSYVSKRISFGFTKIYENYIEIENDYFYKKISKNDIDVYYLGVMPTISILKKQDNFKSDIGGYMVLIVSYLLLIGLMLFFALQ